MVVVFVRTNDEMNSRQLPNGVPDGVESACGKLVYCFVSARGGATVEELSDDLDITRLTLFAVLSTLEERGVVAREGTYVTARPA